MKIRVLKEAPINLKKTPIDKDKDPTKTWTGFPLYKAKFYMSYAGEAITPVKRYNATAVAEYIAIKKKQKGFDVDKLHVRTSGYYNWSPWKEYTPIMQAWEELNKKETPEKESEIPELVKRYMVKKYKFIGQGDVPGEWVDEVEISGLEGAEEYWKDVKKAIWVTNEDSGKWERVNKHSEIVKIIDWVEDNTRSWGYDEPKDFAADLKKTLGDWAADHGIVAEPGDVPEEIQKAMKQKFSFKNKSGSLMGDPVAGRMTALEIAQYYKKNPSSKMKIWYEENWLPPHEATDIKKILDYLDDTAGKKEAPASWHAFDKKLFYLRKDGYYLTPAHQSIAKWTAMEVALYLQKLTDDEMMDWHHTVRRFEDPAMGARWVDVAEDPMIQKASQYLMGKSPKVKKDTGDKKKLPQVRTVDGIKMRIGDRDNPCTDWSPANSGKPLGNKQFDPQTTGAIHDRYYQWECNTEVEQEILQVLEDFVTQNTKPQQEIINSIIEASRESSPKEPLHPEDNVDFLFRGSSRENLASGPFSPVAKDILKNIDWSSIVEELHTLGNKWAKFKYNGSFELAFPVASWTDERNTAAEFAKGGPAQNMSGARPFQFIYEVTPGGAKTAGGTFINFEELYKLEGNPKAVASGVNDIFSGFGGYQAFDNEVLLLGQEGASIPVEYIWVNWDFLTNAKTKGMLYKEDKEILKKIVALERSHPNLRKDAAFKKFEQWNDKMKKNTDDLIERWHRGNKVLKKAYDKSREPEWTQEGAEAMRKRFPISWFDHWHEKALKLYNKVDQLSSRWKFQGKGQSWNVDKSHPWNGMSHELFLDSGDDIKESLIHFQDKLSWLGSQIKGAKNEIHEHDESSDDAATTPGSAKSDKKKASKTHIDESCSAEPPRIALKIR